MLNTSNDQRKLLPNFEQLFTTTAQAPGGVARLRELILTLAVQGKLVPQDASDEPASELLKKIRAEKDRLIAEGKIKKDKPLAEITEGEKPFELPFSWVWVRLGILGEIVGGGTPKSDSSEYWTDDGVAWVTPADLYGKKDIFISRGRRDITELGLSSSSAKLMPKGSVLFSSRAPIGYVAISSNPIATNQGFKSCVPYFSEFNKFIYWHLKYSGPIIDAGASGTTFKEISGRDFSEVLIALPPVAEQSRIVARVEELMHLCDALEEKGRLEQAQHQQLLQAMLDSLTQTTSTHELARHWQRLAQHFDLLIDRPEGVDALEQTILQLAVRGLLVEQDANDEPASELLKKIQAEKDRLINEKSLKKIKSLPEISDEEVSFDLPSGWSWTRLQNAYDVRDGTHDTPKYQSSGFPLVTSKNIYGGFLDLNDVKFISADDHKKISERSKVERNDIIFAMIGSIGNPVIVNTDVEFSVKNVALFKYYAVNLSCPKFLLLVLQSEVESIKARAGGGVQAFVSLGQLRLTPVGFPPLAEQSRIVARVTELRALCQQLREKLTQARSTQTQLAQAWVEQAAA
ncbi:UNVERIFIED_CONTAM: restriction endonuclease subunit S [Comamonas sp. A-3]|nr:restriction endonuclease subunit S [Comamonas thiooxydans]